MVKRLFKIRDKEITKDEFYDNALKDGVSFATIAVIKSIFDKINFYNEINNISSRMQITVIYRKMDAMYDNRFHTEYLDFRFFHEEIKRAYVRSINITHLIAMNTKDYLLHFHELGCNAKDEFDRIFDEFKEKIEMNGKENKEMPVGFEHHPYSRQDLFKNINIIPAHSCPDIERVIFQEPATIVFWKDGSKTVVKVQKGEKYDPEKGLAMAYVKRLLGNCYAYYDIFKKNLPKECRKKAAKSKK